MTEALCINNYMDNKKEELSKLGISLTNNPGTIPPDADNDKLLEVLDVAFEYMTDKITDYPDGKRDLRFELHFGMGGLNIEIFNSREIVKKAMKSTDSPALLSKTWLEYKMLEKKFLKFRSRDDFMVRVVEDGFDVFVHLILFNAYDDSVSRGNN